MCCSSIPTDAFAWFATVNLQSFSGCEPARRHPTRHVHPPAGRRGARRPRDFRPQYDGVAAPRSRPSEVRLIDNLRRCSERPTRRIVRAR
jgi:hypothetical protein